MGLLHAETNQPNQPAMIFWHQTLIFLHADSYARTLVSAMITFTYISAYYFRNLRSSACLLDTDRSSASHNHSF